MPTFKTVIYPHYKRADGVYRVRIRVIHNKQQKYIPTNYYASQNEITPKFDFKRGTSYERDAEPQIEKYRKLCNLFADKIGRMTVHELVAFLDSHVDTLDNFKLDFIAYGRNYVAHLKSIGRIGDANIYQSALNAVVRFTKRESLDIAEINTKFVASFVDFLQHEKTPTNPNPRKRTPSLYYSKIQTLHNIAKDEFNDEEAGIIRIPLSPFVKVKKPACPKTEHSSLSLAQLRKVFTMPDDTYINGIRKGRQHTKNLARDVAMISFYIVGINMVDLFTAEPIKNGRLTYYRTKTRTRRANKAKISIKIAPEIMPLILKYKDKTGKRAFNFYQLYSTCPIFTYQVNKGLKRIGREIGFEKLTTYTFRRTWATIAWYYCGVRDDIIDFALGHSPAKSSQLAHIYITENWGLADAANEKVIKAVNSKSTKMELSNTLSLPQQFAAAAGM